MSLWAGWAGYDHEVEINLFIMGKDVLSKSKKVSAEILKTGGAKMSLMWNKKLVTNFEKQEWFYTIAVDKVWIDDMNKI